MKLNKYKQIFHNELNGKTMGIYFISTGTEHFLLNNKYLYYTKRKCDATKFISDSKKYIRYYYLCG
jgi:hypothetical protein